MSACLHLKFQTETAPPGTIPGLRPGGTQNELVINSGPKTRLGRKVEIHGT